MSDFNQIIQENKPTLVDFFATWCGPCRAQAPILEAVKEKMGDKVNILKVDVDQNGALAQQSVCIRKMCWCVSFTSISKQKATKCSPQKRICLPEHGRLLQHLFTDRCGWPGPGQPQRSFYVRTGKAGFKICLFLQKEEEIYNI